jgi:hypothetical protein
VGGLGAAIDGMGWFFCYELGHPRSAMGARDGLVLLYIGANGAIKLTLLIGSVLKVLNLLTSCSLPLASFSANLGNDQFASLVIF